MKQISKEDCWKSKKRKKASENSKMCLPNYKSIKCNIKRGEERIEKNMPNFYHRKSIARRNKKFNSEDNSQLNSKKELVEKRDN